jgi:regulator of nucleoside diphosphate kinase
LIRADLRRRRLAGVKTAQQGSDPVNANADIHAVSGLPAIKLTILNFWKLDSLLRARAEGRSWRADAILARELKRAIVMDDAQIPGDVATMGSRVKFRIGAADMAEIATLVYPGEAHMFADAISVLTPLGSALLGLAEGQSMPHLAPDGAPLRVSMLRVLHQPEAADRRERMGVDRQPGALRLEPA